MEAGTLQISLSLTGKEQKIASNGQAARAISSDRQQRVAMIELAAVEAAPTVQGEAVSIGPAVEVAPVIWTARLRTGRVVTFRASGSRAFKGGGFDRFGGGGGFGGDRFGGGGGGFGGDRFGGGGGFGGGGFGRFGGGGAGFRGGGRR